MSTPFKTVISASRRTDIPSFYMNWFMERIKKGFFEVTNPFNRKTSIINADPGSVHTIVFWSKNFSPLIKGEFGKKLLDSGYNLFFNFTINSEDRVLEPGIPPLAERIRQLVYLCTHFGKKCVQWRFDPVCYYRSSSSQVNNNLDGFPKIAEKAASIGVSRCITSFMDDYRKIRRRVESIPGFSFFDPDLSKKIEILLRMEQVLENSGINLYTCCEKEVMNSMPESTSISAGSCIPSNYLMELYGGSLSLKKDTGQRVENGCKCMISSDIGSYDMHPCGNNCLFCYANPVDRNTNDNRIG